MARHYGGGRRGLAVFLVIFVAAVIFFSVTVSAHLSPIVRTMGMSVAQQLANRAVYDAVAEVLSEHQITYDDLVRFEKDGSGRITALKTDIANTNRLKSMISLNVIERLQNARSATIYIPMGNLLKNELLSGRGPDIKIRLVPVSEVSVEIKNEFTSAGINQTRHQILMQVSAYVSVLLPTGKAGTTVSPLISIAETIIVGTVPDSYTVVNGDDASIPGLINDYANQPH